MAKGAHGWWFLWKNHGKFMWLGIYPPIFSQLWVTSIWLNVNLSDSCFSVHHHKHGRRLGWVRYRVPITLTQNHTDFCSILESGQYVKWIRRSCCSAWDSPLTKDVVEPFTQYPRNICNIPCKLRGESAINSWFGWFGIKGRITEWGIQRTPNQGARGPKVTADNRWTL